MLKKLSGTTHNVYSGVVLYTGALGVENPYLFYEKTQVTFGVLEDDDIRSYIKTGEPMDKAGAYGIQGRARCFIEHLSGCHNNVMGFPVQRFCKELRYLIGENKI
jgi:septum formation protein